MSRFYRVLLGVMFLILASGFAQAQEGEVDNGTDPTRLSRTAGIQFKHTDLRYNFSSNLFEFFYTEPLGKEKRSSLTLNVPVTQNDASINDHYGLGDVSLKLTNVTKLTPSYGIVFLGEVLFDTAERPELGTGQTVFKGTGIYAKFLKGGAIFAPALVHSIGLGDQENRPRVNNTTLDFYYVPKLDNPLYFITLDPALTFDWQTDSEYASLTVTFGRVIGRVFGGTSSVYIKPQILVGDERPADWSMQIGIKVIGF